MECETEKSIVVDRVSCVLRVDESQGLSIHYDSALNSSKVRSLSILIYYLASLYLFTDQGDFPSI